VEKLDLHYGGLDAIESVVTSRDKQVSLVIYEQVFEHLANPKDELAKLRRFMPVGSLLYIGVPGLKNIDRHYDSNFIRYLQFAHLIHFDLSRLSAMLSGYGFLPLAGDEVVRALYTSTQRIFALDYADYKATLRFLVSTEIRWASKVRHQRLRELPLLIGRQIKKVIFLLPLPHQAKTKIVDSLRRVKNWTFK
jgi:hypothetical protein